jgi:hypothetical protein
MQGEPAERPLSPEESDQLVLRLQQQMTRLKRWFAWERWRLEPRAFEPPDDLPAGDPPGLDSTSRH